jgi:hypothetical protein
MVGHYKNIRTQTLSQHATTIVICILYFLHPHQGSLCLCPRSTEGVIQNCLVVTKSYQNCLGCVVTKPGSETKGLWIGWWYVDAAIARSIPQDRPPHKASLHKRILHARAEFRFQPFITFNKALLPQGKSPQCSIL